MHHALSCDVVRQAGEGLEADDAPAFMVKKVDHVCREEPAFPGTVAQRKILGGPLGELGDGGDFMEALGVLYGLFQGLPVPFHDIAEEGIFQIVLEAAVQVLSLETGIQCAVEEEVEHAAGFRFAAVLLDGTDDVVGGNGGEFYVNFADDADPGTSFRIRQGKAVEVLHHGSDVFLIDPVSVIPEEGFAALLLPFSAEGFRTARILFVGTGPVQALLEGVSVNDGLKHADAHGHGEFEAGLRFKALGIEGNHRDLRQSRFRQSPAEEADVVGGTAHAAGLGKHDCRLVRIVFAGPESPHQGADGDDGRIACIIVDEGKPFLDISLYGRQDLYAVAFAPGGRFDDREVNGGHFRYKDGIVLLHFLREGSPFIMDFRRSSFRPDTLFDGCLERAETNADRTQVQALVDFQAGVEAVSLGHDFLNLIGDDCIKAAAEGIQLDKLQVAAAGDVVGSLVKAAVPGPLVHDAKFREFPAHHGNAVFGQNGHAELIDQVRNGVVYRGVHMVGASCKDNADDVLFIDFLQDALCFFQELCFVFLFRILSGTDGGLDFIAGNAQRLEDLFQLSGQVLRRMEGQERMVESGFVFRQDFIHIGLDVFRIRCHHRAVVAVCGAFVRALVDAGVPDKVHVAPRQIPYMGMGQLGREAFRIGGNRFHRFGGDIPELLRGGHDPVAQTGEESMPEGEIFIHIQRPRNAHGASPGFLRGKRFPAPDGIVFPTVNIGQGRMGSGLAGEHDRRPSFAAVSRYEGTAVVEAGNGDEAVVAAAGAALHFVFKGELLQILQRNQGGSVVFIAGVPGDEGNSVGAHQAGHIGPDNMAVQQLFQCAEHGVIIEGAALNDDFCTQLGGIAETDDLVKGVLDDGIGKACRDICHGNPVFLGLADTGIHEDRAAGAEIGRMFGRKGDAGEFPDVHAQGMGKGIEEGAAAGGAGFVQQDIIHGTVLDAAAFHVLSADVQNGGYIGKEMTGASVVGHGFHFAYIAGEGTLDEIFPVAGDTGAADNGFFGETAVQIGKNLLGSGKRSALIAVIKFIQDFSVLIQEHCLDGGGAGIDAEPDRTLCLGNVASRRMETAVPFLKFLIFLRGSKERVQAGDVFLIAVAGLFHPFEPAVQIEGPVMAGGNGRPHGDIEFPVIGDNHIFIGDVQSLLETLAQNRLEGQRTAEEAYLPADRTAAGQAGNGLVHHRLEYGKSNILMGGIFIEQRLDIRLGKNAAPGGDGMNLFGPGSKLSHTGSIRGKQGSHAVDESTGSAGAGAVHALVHAVAEVRDLFILPAQLNDDIGFGMECLYGFCLGKNLLAEREPHQLGQSHAAASGNGCGDPAAGELRLQLLEKRHRCSFDIGHVPFVSPEEKLHVRRKRSHLYCGGSYINPYMDDRFHEITSLPGN